MLRWPAAIASWTGGDGGPAVQYDPHPRDALSAVDSSSSRHYCSLAVRVVRLGGVLDVLGVVASVQIVCRNGGVGPGPCDRVAGWS